MTLVQTDLKYRACNRDFASDPKIKKRTDVGRTIKYEKMERKKKQKKKKFKNDKKINKHIYIGICIFM